MVLRAHLQGSGISRSGRLNSFPSITWFYTKKGNLNGQIDSFFICQNERDVKNNFSPINHLSPGFSHIFQSWAHPFFSKGFWQKAWIWSISCVRFSLRKGIGRIQPLTFGFQTTMKNKDFFSQDNKVTNTAPSHFGFLEEMNWQVSFYERSSFSQLSACCYVPSGMNVCINWRRGGRRVELSLPVLQIQQPE